MKVFLALIFLILILSDDKTLRLHLDKSAKEIVIKSLKSIEIENKIDDINSIFGNGIKIYDADTFSYVTYKMLYARYKISKSNLSYHELIIKNEDSSYHQRNDKIFKRRNQYYDTPLFDNLVNFNIYYALYENLKKRNFELISSDNKVYKVLFKQNTGDYYIVYFNQEDYLISKYHRYITEHNTLTQTVLLSDYKNIDGVLYPMQKEFISNQQSQKEIIKYDSIAFNSLDRSDFNLP